MWERSICSLKETVMQTEKLPANNRWQICAASGNLLITATSNLSIIREIYYFYENVLHFLILSIPFSLYTAHDGNN